MGRKKAEIKTQLIKIRELIILLLWKRKKRKIKSQENCNPSKQPNRLFKFLKVFQKIKRFKKIRKIKNWLPSERWGLHKCLRDQQSTFIQEEFVLAFICIFQFKKKIYKELQSFSFNMLVKNELYFVRKAFQSEPRIGKDKLKKKLT